MINNKKKFILLFLIIISIFSIKEISFANNSLDDFIFKKDIIVNSKKEYTYFIIDKDIYLNSNYNLNDILIINDLNELVPYSIKIDYNLKGKLSVDYNLFNNNKYTNIHIKNNEFQNLNLDKIFFDINHNFKNNFQIESNFIDVVELYKNNNSKKLHISMRNQEHNEDINIKINNNGKTPLNINEINLIYNHKYIIFKPEKNRSYYIYFKSQNPIFSNNLDNEVSEISYQNMQRANLRNMIKLKDINDTEINNKSNIKLTFFLLLITILIIILVNKKNYKK